MEIFIKGSQTIDSMLCCHCTRPAVEIRPAHTASRSMQTVFTGEFEKVLIVLRIIGQRDVAL